MFKFFRNLILVRYFNVFVRMYGIFLLVNLEGGCFVLFFFWKNFLVIFIFYDFLESVIYIRIYYMYVSVGLLIFLFFF